MGVMNDHVTALPDREPSRSHLDRALHSLSAVVAWLVLHPVRLPALLTPALQRLPYRVFRLKGDGVSLAAWHVPREGSRAGIVLCHGHNDCRAQFFHLLRPLHEAGFHLLLFDHRSMGLSGGRMCTYGHYEQHDVGAAVEWLRREAGCEQVGLLGYSMGGATALLAAAADPGVDAVVTDCAFARLSEMVERRFIHVPAPLRGSLSRSVRYWTERWTGITVTGVDPEAAVRGWKPRPLLVIHGERDLLIPLGHAERLTEAGGEQAELWAVPAAGHVACRRKMGRAYADRLVLFFRRHLRNA
jgi:uncharacterized protein